MAKTDVQILITAKDMASPAFANLTKAADSAKIAVSGFGEQTSAANRILTSMTGFAAAQLGIAGLEEALSHTAGEMLSFYKLMQQGVISTAGTLMSAAKIGDRDLEWNEAFRMSTQLMREMADQAVATGVSTQALSDSFRAALPSALQAGMKVSELMKLLAPLTATGKLIGLNDTTLMRDISDLISGMNVQRTKLGQVLGITSEDIRKAKENGDLYTYLSDRLKGEVIAVTKYLETWEGRVNHLKEAIARVGGTGLEGAFDTIKEDIQAIAEELVLVDKETQEVYVRPEAVEAFREIGDAAIDIEKALKGVVADFSWISDLFGTGSGLFGFGIDNLRYIIDGLIVKAAADKATATIRNIRNGLAGVGTQTSLLGTLAAGAAGEIAKSEAAIKAAQLAVNDGVKQQITLEKELLAVKTNVYQLTTGKRAQKAVASATSGNTIGDMYVRGGETSGTYAAQAVQVTQAAALNKQAIQTQKLTAIYTAANAAAAKAQADAELLTAANYKVRAAYAAAGTAAMAAGNKASYAAQLAVTGADRATVSIDAQKLSVGALGRAYATTGAAGKLAFTPTISVIEKVGLGLKGLLVTVKELAGGWLGLGVMAAFAGSEMLAAWNQNRKDTRERTVTVSSGRRISKNNNGDYVLMRTLNGNEYAWTQEQLEKEYQSGVHKGNLAYAPIRQNEIESYEARAEELKVQREAEEMKRIKAHADAVAKAAGEAGSDTDWGNINNLQTRVEKGEEESAKSSEKVASVMQQNANLIAKANSAIRNVIVGLEEQLRSLRGSTYDKDVASAKKSYTDTLNTIAQSFPSLKTVENKEPIIIEDGVQVSGGNESTGTEPAHAEDYSRAMYALNFLNKAGLNLEAAAGVVGNLMAESTENLATNAVNPESGAYGIAQWLSPDRVEGLSAYAESMGTSIEDFDTQLNYIVKELQAFGLTEKLNAVGSAAEAAILVDNEYEISGGETQGVRVENANAILERFAANKSGMNLSPSTRTTYTPAGVTEAEDLAATLRDEKLKEALRNLGIRQRKQETETTVNELTAASGDNRTAIINAQSAQSYSEIEDKRRNIFQAIAGDTGDSTEKARAEAETERAIQAERQKLAMETAQQLRALEDTQHEERLSHISYLTEKEKLTASEVQRLREQELADFLAAKEKEVESEKLTAEQRIALEKQVVEAKQALDEERQKSYGSIGTQLADLAREWSADTGTVVKDGFDTIVGEFSNLGQNIISEQKSISEIMRSLWEDLANDILNMALKVAMNNAIQSLFSSIFGSNNPLAGKASGGVVDGKATGGFITGPGTATSDSIPTMLSNGEYVVKASAVKSVGTGFLDAINNGYIKHFATGGMVGSPSAGGSGKTAPNVKINITNNTNSQVSAETSDVKFDGESYILSVVMNGIATNKGGLRSVLKGV